MYIIAKYWMTHGLHVKSQLMASTSFRRKVHPRPTSSTICKSFNDIPLSDGSPGFLTTNGPPVESFFSLHFSNGQVNYSMVLIGMTSNQCYICFCRGASFKLLGYMAVRLWRKPKDDYTASVSIQSVTWLDILAIQ
jgi:hypothetical protein